MSCAKGASCAGALGAFFGLCSQALAADATRLQVNLEVGAEVDTNALRAPAAEPPVTSPLWRITTGLQVAMRPAARQLIVLSDTLGGKIFFARDAQGENVLVDDAHAAWSYTATPTLSAELGLDYYDAFQQGSVEDPRRDFRLGGMGPRLVLAGESDEIVTAFAGYRAFQYKIDPQQDYWGPYFGAALRKRWLTGPVEDEREWQLDASYFVNPRTFNGEGFRNPDQRSGLTRNDLFHFGELRGTYTGAFLLGLGYGVQWNDSSSYGFGLLRHIVTLRFASPLWGRLRLASRATLQVLQLADPVPLDPRLFGGDTFENENRSSVEVALEHPLGDSFRIIARYSYFASALGTAAGADFSRHLVFFGAAYRFDR